MLTFIDYPADCSKPTYGEEHHGNEVVKNVSVYFTASVGHAQLDAIKAAPKAAAKRAQKSNGAAAGAGAH